MTLDLSDLRAKWEAATRDLRVEDYVNHEDYDGAFSRIVSGEDGVYVADLMNHADAMFYVAAHAAFPELLNELTMLRANQREHVIAWFDENKDEVVKNLGDMNGILEKENDELRAELAAEREKTRIATKYINSLPCCVEEKHELGCSHGRALAAIAAVKVKT